MANKKSTTHGKLYCLRVARILVDRWLPLNYYKQPGFPSFEDDGEPIHI